MFVLLEHTTRDGVHWDFIIEVPGREFLATWRLPQNPLTTSGDISAEPIAGHPPHFLEYEGSLRQGFGSVRRVDRGQASIRRFDSQALVARLSGEHLRGHIEIIAEADGLVRFRTLARPEDASGP